MPINPDAYMSGNIPALSRGGGWLPSAPQGNITPQAQAQGQNSVHPHIQNGDVRAQPPPAGVHFSAQSYNPNPAATSTFQPQSQGHTGYPLHPNQAAFIPRLPVQPHLALTEALQRDNIGPLDSASQPRSPRHHWKKGNPEIGSNAGQLFGGPGFPTHHGLKASSVFGPMRYPGWATLPVDGGQSEGSINWIGKGGEGDEGGEWEFHSGAPKPPGPGRLSLPSQQPDERVLHRQKAESLPSPPPLPLEVVDERKRGVIAMSSGGAVGDKGRTRNRKTSYPPSTGKSCHSPPKGKSRSDIPPISSKVISVTSSDSPYRPIPRTEIEHNDFPARRHTHEPSPAPLVPLPTSGTPYRPTTPKTSAEFRSPHKHVTDPWTSSSSSCKMSSSSRPSLPRRKSTPAHNSSTTSPPLAAPRTSPTKPRYPTNMRQVSHPVPSVSTVSDITGQSRSSVGDTVDFTSPSGLPRSADFASSTLNSTIHTGTTDGYIPPLSQIPYDRYAPHPASPTTNISSQTPIPFQTQAQSQQRIHQEYLPPGYADPTREIEWNRDGPAMKTYGVAWKRDVPGGPGLALGPSGPRWVQARPPPERLGGGWGFSGGE